MEVNLIIKKELIKSPASIGQIISKIVTENEKKEGKIKTTHKKTESAINMYVYDSRKVDNDIEASSAEENRKRMKKNKGFKTMADNSIKKLVSKRTDSPPFETKENLETGIRLKEGKMSKIRRS